MARSSYSTGRSSGGSEGYEPKVNRDPFYKTMGIFNSIFKKDFKLVADSHNATDCKKNIYVNFGETKFSSIVGFSRPSERDSKKSFYILACGHEWEGNAGHPLDGSKPGACWTCGSHQAYLGFEHEWQHIIFKSDIPAQHMFCEGYADQLQKIAPHVERKEITDFLKMMVNAFDDIRCNSLWEKIYPGSAEQIWQRWARLTRESKRKLDENFLTFIFAVAFDVPTDTDGPFEQLRPIVEWAVSKVKYRGFANMLLQVRVVVENCMATILANTPASAKPPPQQPQPQDQNDAQSSSQGTGDAGADDPAPQAHGNDDDHGSSQDKSDLSSAAAGDAGPGSTQSPGAPNPSASSGVPAKRGDAGDDQGRSEVQKSKALQALVADANPLEGEKHLDPDFVDIDEARKSNAMKAMLAGVLGTDATNLQDIDQKMPTGVPDPDMQSTIDYVTNAIAKQQPLDSHLTNDAKARITIIDVSPEGINATAVIKLEPETKLHIARMRAAFFQAMGRQKALRSSEGSEIDVQAFIQYKLDRQDPDVFITEDVQQGFSYSIVCDMSGSMQGTFPQVAQASEMLRESLDFPFVRGDVWGFRGGVDKPGDVWMYRYSPHVQGYLGTGYAATNRGRIELPVCCGGITPMNTAINIAARHQHRCVSEGMAKRMFLLTDGSPLQARVSGGQISTETLMRFVAGEVKKARNRGIQVYALVIGEHAIEEKDCLKMFGPRKFWRRVATKEVGRELSNLVIDNFKKYLLNKN